MSGLDYRLYEWLTEADERRFERAFGAYFLVAFPAVVRHLAKLSHWDIGELEDLAQEALLKFFARVGPGRRAAAQAVASALPRIRPLNLGALHERQVTLWTGRVAAFREAAMSFRVAGPESSSAGWKALVRDLADRALLLQGQGCQLLGDVERALRVGGIELDDAARPDAATLRDGARRFAVQMAACTASALAAERHCPAVRAFCADVYAVSEAISRLRVPANSFLFEIAASTYFDESKKRRRQKRVGLGPAVSADYLRDAQHADRLEESPPDFDGHLPGYDEAGDPVTAPLAAGNPLPLAAPAIDPAQRCEDQDLFEKFYLYLREPLDNAIRDHQAAQALGSAAAHSQRRRVAVLTNKFARTMSVLSQLGEGYSQEHTAERLGLSRNQVKYVIESAQRAYGEFAAATMRSTSRSPERDSYVR